MVEERLTKTEHKVLQLIGFSRNEIAKHLGVELSTVQSHLANIRTKLCAKSMAQIAVIALTQGLLDIKECDLGFWDRDNDYIEDKQLIDLRRERCTD